MGLLFDFRFPLFDFRFPSFTVRSAAKVAQVHQPKGENGRYVFLSALILFEKRNLTPHFCCYIYRPDPTLFVWPPSRLVQGGIWREGGNNNNNNHSFLRWQCRRCIDGTGGWDGWRGGNAQSQRVETMFDAKVMVDVWLWWAYWRLWVEVMNRGDAQGTFFFFYIFLHDIVWISWAYIYFHSQHQ